jgi:hypothetical protein
MIMAASPGVSPVLGRDYDGFQVGRPLPKLPPPKQLTAQEYAARPVRVSARSLPPAPPGGPEVWSPVLGDRRDMLLRKAGGWYTAEGDDRDSSNNDRIHNP